VRTPIEIDEMPLTEVGTIWPRSGSRGRSCSGP